MKRIILLLLLTAMPVMVSATTVTVTGTVTVNNNPVNGTLTLQLPVPAIDTSTNQAISPGPFTFRLINGAVQAGATVIPTDVMQPLNLWYTAQVRDTAGTLMLSAIYVIPSTPSTFNIGLAIPTIVTTNNISYLSPASLNSNNIFTGNNFVRVSDIDGSASLLMAAIGDSLTACAGIVVPANCTPNRIAAAKNLTLSNVAVSGTGANDQQQIGAIIQTANGVTNGTYTWLCCVNDMRLNLNATQQQTWGQTVEAGLWWLATPDANKVLASSAGVTYVGSWITPPSSYGGTMRAATSNGATASFSVFGSDVVVIGAWQVLQVGSGSATWNVSVDGTLTSPTVTTSTGSYQSILFSTNFGPTFVHYNNLPEQTHTVTLTCVTATVQNPCYFIAGGTSSGATAGNGKWVTLGNTARLVNPTGYNVTTAPGCAVAPCGSDSLVQQFDDLERQIVADLQGMNLNVAYADINAPGFYVPNGTNTQADGVHPTDIGDGLIANAFLSTMKGFISPGDRGAAQGWGIGIRSSFSINGIGQFGMHMVEDSVTLAGGTFTVTLIGQAQYQGAGTYTCVGNDSTALNPVKISNTTGNTFVVTGTGTDIIRIICEGR